MSESPLIESSIAKRATTQCENTRFDGVKLAGTLIHFFRGSNRGMGFVLVPTKRRIKGLHLCAPCRSSSLDTSLSLGESNKDPEKYHCLITLFLTLYCLPHSEPCL
jgi:hypothetical protein